MAVDLVFQGWDRQMAWSAGRSTAASLLEWTIYLQMSFADSGRETFVKCQRHYCANVGFMTAALKMIWTQ